MPEHLPWPPNERSICDLPRLPGTCQSPYCPFNWFISHLLPLEAERVDVMGEQKGMLGQGERIKVDTYSVEEVGELPLKTKTNAISHTLTFRY